MKQDHLRLSPFLKEIDHRVPHTDNGKELRPFIGIILSIEGKDYYAPLTSPKSKHLKMKNQVDFLKINEGKWGAINFNNMIPVRKDSLLSVDLSILPTDSKNDIDYKTLMSNQLSWCNSNRDKIFEQAVKLHNAIILGLGRQELINRCCDFKRLEEACDKYTEEYSHDSNETVNNVNKNSAK